MSAPSNIPPSLPSLVRNSSMICAFQSVSSDIVRILRLSAGPIRRRVATGFMTCSTTTSTVLSCAWRTRRFAVGPHTLTAVAIDTSGHRSTRSIVVTVQR
jgi:hypothetical protein